MWASTAPKTIALELLIKVFNLLLTKLLSFGPAINNLEFLNLLRISIHKSIYSALNFSILAMPPKTKSFFVMPILSDNSLI